MNTKYIIEVSVKAPDGAEPDYSLEFYVEREQTVVLDKSELVRVITDNGEKYFALLDLNMKRGHLMCCVRVKDNEPLFERTQEFRVYTGVTLGGCLCKREEVTRCGGYTFTFNAMEDVPKDINALIYYGVIKQNISYNEITESSLRVLDKQKEGILGRTGIEVSAGDRVVILVPSNSLLVPKKDNGFGSKVAFDTSVMGANGEIKVIANGIEYRVYGELMTVDGILYIYID